MNEKIDYFETNVLCVGYDEKEVLRNVNLSLKKGEILALVGPNGAGKTTFLKSIIKELKLLSGEVLLEGVSLLSIAPRDLSKQLAVVLTNRLQGELLTVFDVVATGRHPYTGHFGMLGEHDRDICMEAMELVQVEKLWDQDFTKISDGQRQRVMLARALAQEPDLIVLDEPTSFLDIKYKLEFLTVLRKLSKEKKVTVILSLHEVELAKLVADKVACFKDGSLDRFGSPKEVFADGYVQKLFAIDPEKMAPEFLSYMERFL